MYHSLEENDVIVYSRERTQKLGSCFTVELMATSAQMQNSIEQTGKTNAAFQPDFNVLKIAIVKIREITDFPFWQSSFQGSGSKILPNPTVGAHFRFLKQLCPIKF